MNFKSLSLLLCTLCLALADSYILIFEQGQVTPNEYVQSVRENIIKLGGTIKYDYTTLLTGFAFSVPDDVTLNSVKELSDEKYPFFIEKDSEVHNYA
ncbi:uncharacterized protein CYBJADRAFT_174470 [Cyberlindnera jadinii NRRL Y-1542]|uniref:Inhibitor I9 domain-containing protein n=1 Tax=Cyberlindnera jadinii (strain ATCC 18201 / CBS 1600 / BCRC 20928 / JCM 3617 / NBRC 0987 / NRRL Y-1542) TaxID=983966 RepID=A0A1E4RY46_CYBJN|nr:hypothetical protein CYBJADRAFT_174470 [Cyberlindnera jadinii NRRL Y-1542]ODV72213.1 hypothetical protein CYBJADRAFT_174470 [Cyberlindnera jadinii NRRL Y-1542]